MISEVLPPLAKDKLELFLGDKDGHTPAVGEWGHRDLIHVAAALLIAHPGQELHRLKMGLQRLNLAGGGNKDGYHHTQTAGWLELVRQLHARYQNGIWEHLDQQLYDSHALLAAYYWDTLFSERAVRDYVEPDRGPVQLLAPLPDSDNGFWRSFCLRTLSQSDWTHQAHLRAAKIAIGRYNDQALAVMRYRIRRLNEAHGLVETPTRGYHETVTWAFLQLVERCLQMGTSEGLMMRSLSAPNLLYGFYSKEQLNSLQARQVIVPPDLQPITEFCP